MNAPWWRPAPSQTYTSISTCIDSKRTTDDPDTDQLPPFVD